MNTTGRGESRPRHSSVQRSSALSTLWDKFADVKTEGGMRFDSFAELCKSTGIELSEEEIICIPSKLDKNHLGVINLKEFEQCWRSNDPALALRLSKPEEAAVQFLRRLFRKYWTVETQQLEWDGFQKFHSDFVGSQHQHRHATNLPKHAARAWEAALSCHILQSHDHASPAAAEPADKTKALSFKQFGMYMVALMGLAEVSRIQADGEAAEADMVQQLEQNSLPTSSSQLLNMLQQLRQTADELISNFIKQDAESTNFEISELRRELEESKSIRKQQSINQALHELLAEQHLQFEIDAKLRLTDCLAQFGLIDLTRADHQADAAKPAESSATSRRGQSLWDMISDAMLPAEPAKLADVVLANASSGPLPKMQSSALADSASANGQFKLKMLKPTGSFLVPDTMKQDSNLTKKPNGATNLQDARRASALPRMFDGDSSSEDNDGAEHEPGITVELFDDGKIFVHSDDDLRVAVNGVAGEVDIQIEKCPDDTTNVLIIGNRTHGGIAQIKACINTTCVNVRQI